MKLQREKDRRGRTVLHDQCHSIGELGIGNVRSRDLKDSGERSMSSSFHKPSGGVKGETQRQGRSDSIGGKHIRLWLYGEWNVHVEVVFIPFIELGGYRTVPTIHCIELQLSHRGNEGIEEWSRHRKVDLKRVGVIDRCGEGKRGTELIHVTLQSQLS